MFCSLGCGLAFRSVGENFTAIDYDFDNPVNHGSLCPRGYYNYELLNNPAKLIDPYIAGRKSSWADATSYIKEKLGKYSGHEVAIIISENATNEDAYVAVNMAKELRTKNIAAMGDKCNADVSRGYTWGEQGPKVADITKIGNYDALLIVGDLLTRSPVLSKAVNSVKYGKRGNQVIVIDANNSHTSWFATNHLKVNPGTEAVLLAGLVKVVADVNKKPSTDIDLKQVAAITGISEEQIIRTAKAWDDAGSGCVIFAPSDNMQRNDLVQYFASLMQTYSIDKAMLTMLSYGNARGVNRILNTELTDHATLAEIEMNINNGTIKAVFMFGEDMELPLSVELPVKATFFRDQNDLRSVYLPLASYMERKGTIMFSGANRNTTLTPIAHKIGGRAIWKIITSIMKINLGFDGILKETANIMAKGSGRAHVDIGDKAKEAMQLTANAPSKENNITHFGNNKLARNFFWWRANNNG